MANSMTGFGSAEGSVIGGRMAVDIKSVNHRHFNLQARMPAVVQHLEQALRERMRRHIARGHVNIGVRWIEEPPRALSVRVNVERARAVYAALTQLKQELDLAGDIEVSFIARQPEVLEYATGDEQPDVEPEFVAVVDEALDQLVVMRQREGTALTEELRAVLNTIETRLRTVEGRAPTRLVRERERLQDAVSKLLDGRSINQERLELELALLADKLDIAEEVVRLRTHLSASREALESSDPVGRKLAFLGQEMLREINTIGSKANDAEITQTVIDMKGELEKFREQVENLE
jgi:uncharacterized protein (TIGR00255 family)